jgi:predicted N-acetyltransferase YhbS
MRTLEPLTSQSEAAIDALLDAAFGRDRHGRTAYRIRAGAAWLPALSFAAVEQGVLVGTLQSWPVALHRADSVVPLVMVGPVAVRPERQGDGVGRALMDRLVDAAERLRTDPLMMIGDPDYYGRFWGFTAAATAGWQVPGPVERHRLLARSAGGGDVPAGDGVLGPRLVAAA